MKVFIDTMVYLHYRSLEEVDLLSLLDATHLSVVIPRITLRELDKHKNTHSSSRVRERARGVLRRMEEWTRTGAGPRADVGAEFLPKDPPIDFAEHGLSPTWNDDVLIASILDYRSAHPEEEVWLITQDSGPKLTAESLEIAVFQLPDSLRLPSEPDPLEVENRELKRILERLRSAQPELIVGLAGNEEGQRFARFTLSCPSEAVDKDISRRIEELHTALSLQRPHGTERLLPEPVLPETPSASAQSLLAGIGGMNRIPAEEYERYDHDLELYLAEYEEYMRRSWEVEASEQRSIHFEIEIRNVGTAPAEDIDVEVHFPDGFQLLSEDDLPQLPVEPRPPLEPRTLLQVAMGSGIGYMPNLRMSSPPVPSFRMPTSFEIKRTGSYTVSDHFARIKHGTSVMLPELFLVFDSFEAATPFNCMYTMTLANLPDPITGQLHFVIEKENVDGGIDTAE